MEMIINVDMEERIKDRDQFLEKPAKKKIDFLWINITIPLFKI